MPPTYEVLRLAEGYVQVNPLGPVPIKGLSTPLEVYEVTGPGAVRTRLQAASMRGLTRFVGRDTELDQLRQAQERAGFPEAVTAFERAIEALAHLPITLDTRSFAIAFRCDLADGLLPMGELGRSGTLLGEAEALAPQLHDRPRLGHVLAMLAAVRRMQGDLDRAIAVGRQALEMAVELSDRTL